MGSAAGAEAAVPWTQTADGLVVSVRATPRGGRDAIDGMMTLSDGRIVIKARISVAAEDGKANAALARLLAGAAGIAPSAVTLSQGATARLKAFRLSGDPQAMADRLRAILGQA